MWLAYISDVIGTNSLTSKTMYRVHYNATIVAICKTMKGCLEYIKRRGLADDELNLLYITDREGNEYNAITGEKVNDNLLVYPVFVCFNTELEGVCENDMNLSKMFLDKTEAEEYFNHLSATLKAEESDIQLFLQEIFVEGNEYDNLEDLEEMVFDHEFMMGDDLAYKYIPKL